MDLIATQEKAHHVSLDVVKEFEKAIMTDARVRPIAPGNVLVSRAILRTFRALNHGGHRREESFGLRAVPWNPVRNKRDTFAVLMSLDLTKLMPHFMFPGRKSLYLFDAWPDVHLKIRELVKRWDIRHVFVSSSMATERLNVILGSRTCSWVPEGINPEVYRFRSYAERDIDVIQIGRKYDMLHDVIVGPLEQQGKTYLYEKVKGTVVFPTRDEFIGGLSRSKVSLCFPSSLTHPDRSGDIETLTSRYLQSMASKCLVVGHAPREMITLFGYNPVVELDMQSPVRHIMSILKGYSDYVTLVERNYRVVGESHTWHHRWLRIADDLFPGAGVPASKKSSGDVETRGH
ncbi:MAG: hypothetical protein WBD36_14000 [Bacteroidota bacterium]